MAVLVFDNRARTHSLLGNDDEAENDLEKAVEPGYDRAKLEESIQELKGQR